MTVGNVAVSHHADQASSHMSFGRRVWERAKTVMGIALRILVGAGLFLFNSSLFAFGFVAGLIWTKQTDEAIKKISDVWNKQDWKRGLLFGVVAFVALPAFLAASTVLYGAYSGSYFAK